MTNTVLRLISLHKLPCIILSNIWYIIFFKCMLLPFVPTSEAPAKYGNAGHKLALKRNFFKNKNVAEMLGVLVLVYTREGSLWSIVLRCDDHTGIFTCDGCARDPYFYVPAETQSYVIKLSCSRKVLATSGD